MGVGKTLTAIATIWAFVRTKTQRKCLIITPSSLVDNWVKEIKHWLGMNSYLLRTISTCVLVKLIGCCR